MTVATSASYIRHTIAAGAASKPFDMQVAAASHVRVRYITAANPNPAWLTFGVDFTVQLNPGGVGGTVTFTPALTGAGVVEIERHTPRTQTALRLSNIGRFSAESVEAGIDAGVMLVQELEEKIDRALLVERGVTPPAGGVVVSDEPYNATTWNGVANVAPSKNVVRDFFEALLGGVSSAFDSLSEIATELALKAAKATTINAGGIAVGGGDLSADRTITVTAASAAEARAMTATDRALTPANLADIGASRTLVQSALALTHTGNTSETALATISVPAGWPGANGAVHVRAWGSCSPSSANNKQIRARLTSGGVVIGSVAFTTNTTWQAEWWIFNRNSQSSQYLVSLINRATDTVMSVLSGVSGSVDMSSARDIIISAQLGLGSESLTLEALRAVAYLKS